MKERGFSTGKQAYKNISAIGTYRMYNPSTNQVVLTHDVKCHIIYGSNSESDQTSYDFTECTEEKKFIKENTINKKENDNKLDL